MKNLDYPYKPKVWVVAFACLIFGVNTLVMVREAMANDSDLVLNGIPFTTQGATLIYWCVAATSGLFVAAGVSVFFVGLFSSHRLVVTETEVSAPSFVFSRQPTVVPLSSITDLYIEAEQRARTLIIRHEAGKLRIVQSWLPSAAALDEICAALSAAVKAPAAG